MLRGKVGTAGISDRYTVLEKEVLMGYKTKQRFENNTTLGFILLINKKNGDNVTYDIRKGSNKS
jgi:hypothetical protein